MTASPQTERFVLISSIFDIAHSMGSFPRKGMFLFFPSFQMFGNLDV